MAQLGYPHAAVLFNQPHKLQPAVAIASAARDLEHRDLADQVAERDRIASHGSTGRSSARRSVASIVRI